jgi:ATP-dependent RNA helicase RhlE
MEVESEEITFGQLGLRSEVVEAIEAMNFKVATPIQSKAIPIILAGKDLIGVAQTGTGKTAAFVLPVLNEILESGHTGYVQALVIVPTRELAIQIDQAVEAYSYFTGASSIAIYGGGDGNDFNNEKRAIVSGVDIIIATPGRLISHMNVGYVDFSKLKFLILDEADRMLDMGFQPDLLRIVRQTNEARQGLLFSATMPDEIFRFARTLLRNPETVSISLSKPAAGVKQAAYVVYDDQKIPLITEMLKGRVGQSIIVFSSTRQVVSSLYQRLKSKGLNVACISSDLEQSERESVLLSFRNRKVEILVATDVVSRGIDIAGIDMVVNYDVPGDAEDYIHRVGRTARADQKGEAITLIGPADQSKFLRIEMLIGSVVEKIAVPEMFGPTPEYNPRSGGGKSRNSSGKKRPFSSKKAPFNRSKK